ncbi:MAG: hypothetical protein ACTSQF_14865, partial [Candidatus Heimdallarchaeaceae archaeon]
MKLFKKIENESTEEFDAEVPEVEVPKNPVDEEMIAEIEKLIENYIPPFMERYAEKLKELTNKNETTIISRSELNQETIKELGIGEIEEPLTRFIMHSVGPKIDKALSSQETEKEHSLELVEKTISVLVEGAVEKINTQIEQLIALVIGEEMDVSQEEMAEDELVAEVIGEYVNIVKDSSDSILEEPIDEIVEYPEIIESTVELPEERTAESGKIPDLDELRDRLIDEMLDKYSQKLEDELSDESELTKA